VISALVAALGSLRNVRAAPNVLQMRTGGHPEHPMKVIGSLIERLQRWFARYRAQLVYAEARDRRRPIAEMEWNGAMIGDLRRRSLDA
jgi:hypothetical protein